MSHRTLANTPREQLEWLAARSVVQHFDTGESIFSPEKPLRTLNVVLTGHMAIRVDRGGGPRKIMEWHAGDVSGVLPYSRLVSAPGRVTAESPSEISMMSADHFPEMIVRCPDLTATLVHVMLDRTRRFTKSDIHDEKMLSLGRLAAGLAHELNNPASALARSAKELDGRLFELEATALALGAVGLSPDRLTAVDRVRQECEQHGTRLALTPLERADREDEVQEWLSRRGFRSDVAAALVETPVTVKSLDVLAEQVPPDALEFALHSIGAACRAQRLLKELETAAARIHTLVAAIKGFTHMDQSNVPKPVDVARGLADTLAVLGGKARRKSVNVSISVPEGLPSVQGFGGELNQVWANLIDNAIDAAPVSGHVEVKACTQGDRVIVRVTDDGPGVPAELMDRIFEPFFTTKPMGEGTGLGLDIARQLVNQHEGQIELDSRPGRTEFMVSLPRLKASPADGDPR